MFSSSLRDLEMKEDFLVMSPRENYWLVSLMFDLTKLYMHKKVKDQCHSFIRSSVDMKDGLKVYESFG